MYRRKYHIKAERFDKGTRNFSLKMVSDTPKHLGKLWHRYVFNIYCEIFDIIEETSNN